MINDRLSHLSEHWQTPIGAGVILLCRIVIVLLWLGVVLTGYQVALQVHQGREAYRTLKQLEKEYHSQQVEYQRLLIEQQTFGATPQIARRAVTELGMFFPGEQDRRVVTPAFDEKPQQNTPPASASKDKP